MLSFHRLNKCCILEKCGPNYAIKDENKRRVFGSIDGVVDYISGRGIALDEISYHGLPQAEIKTLLQHPFLHYHFRN